ncbi:hypothetical protein B7Z28_00055 [Candidatus Saccharibacteria bacterium 32-45-3]|nr:MAG: hypothetical protein B7Z28_00055 [Candidatus Saccharibacteria bacterium 32-45-3]
MFVSTYEFLPGKIAQIVHEATDAVSFRVTIQSPYTYVCGEYALVRVGITQDDTCTRYIRQYSFSSAPSSNEIWFTVTKEPGGLVSSWLCDDAKVGDTIEISRPYTSPLAIKTSRPLLLIAGGSGIAPLMSIVREARTHHPTQPIKLIYTTKTNKVCFEHELTQPHEHETTIINYSDIHGRISRDDILPSVSKNSEILICGSRDFVVTVKSWVSDSVPPSQVHTESFTL